MSDNEDHRRDNRSKTKFREDIINGIRLQGVLGGKLLNQFNTCTRMLSKGFRGMEWETDDTIYENFEDIVGDARMFFGRLTIELEFKTKDQDSEFFTLKRLDLERCVTKGKPIFMANRMESSKMVIRFMSLYEINRMLLYPAVPIEYFGGKLGYRIDENLMDGWISADEMDSEGIFEAYAGSVGKVTPPTVYRWEIKPKEKMEYERMFAIACEKLKAGNVMV